MSGDAPDQTADLIKNLTLDSQVKTNDAEDATKKSAVVPVQNESANGDGTNQAVQSAPSRSPSITPLLNEVNQMTDMSMCYMPNGYPSFIYGGYDGSNNWEDYSRYMNSDGAEMGQGVYGDMYHGYGYTYGSYPSPGSPIPTMGHDGQLYGPQQYQYPASYYQPPTPQPSASFIPNQTPTSQRDISAPVATNQSPVSADTTKTTLNGTAKGNLTGSNVSVPLKPSHQNTSVTTNDAYGRGGMPGGLPTSGYQDPRYGFDGVQSPTPWIDPSLFSGGQHRLGTTSSLSSTYRNGSTPSARTQSQSPLSHYMGMHTPRPAQGMGSASYLDKVYPNNRLHGQFGNTFRNGYGYGTNGYDSRISERWSGANDNKYNKPRGRGNGSYGYGNENLDGFSELNKGPRGNRFKNPKAFGTNVTVASKGQNISTNLKEEASGVIPNMEQYNREDFPEQYSDAKFFIIKSYSEDDVHRSIKYSVWASTPNGNSKLDTAYKEVQERAGGCPVFLFFSVNTSGQFVGAAEMVGPVDFDKTLDYWQQDKWFGCFPVKWHIVKDVPNNFLKHITLENNDNKPVTNSRDTQEVKLEQGLQMLKLFKEHVSKTSILDDFDFYESRQNIMQERKAKQKQFQKQGLDGKTEDAVDEKVKDGTDTEPKPQKPLESVSVVLKEPIHVKPGELKASEGNGDVGAVAGDAPKDASPATESTADSGAANGC